MGIMESNISYKTLEMILNLKFAKEISMYISIVSTFLLLGKRINFLAL